MKRLISFVFMVAVLALNLSVAGCASQVSPQMAAMASAPLASGRARVIVIRPSSLVDAITPVSDVHLFVDGTDHGVLTRLSYQVLDLAPGEHELRLFRPDQTMFSAFNHDGHIRLNAQADQTAFYRFMSFRGRLGISVFFNNMTEQQGQSELAKLSRNES